MRVFFALFVVALLVGCATSAAIVEIPDIEQSSSLSIEDLRPPNEKEDQTFSLLISSEAYGIFRRGDKRLKPDPVRVLQYKIYK